MLQFFDICVTLYCMNKLQMPSPIFKSKLTNLIFDLEHLRDRNLRGSTPPWLFFDLKDIMHQLESLTSARIEGNRTTIMSVVENVIDGSKETKDESLKELRNINKAIEFIEKNVMDGNIDRAFISELHKIVVDGLISDGSSHPGVYRPNEVEILNSKHKPPLHNLVPDLMEELIGFINDNKESQYDLLTTAIVHHRFTAIHPFDNGNGRTVRLLTYAMLTKQHFIDDRGNRLLNPSAIFCMNRQLYYDMLAEADMGTEDGLLKWCEYVLTGIKTEIEKIDRLLDKDFAIDNVIMPALNLALDKKQINQIEYDILKIATSRSPFMVNNIRHLFGSDDSGRVAASRMLAKLKKEKFIMVHPNFKLKYVLRFSNNYLLRGVMQQLDRFDLLPVRADS
jgi:Fic family protein